MEKPIILWIEDDPSSVNDMIQYSEIKGFEVVIVHQPHRILNCLELYSDRLVLVVIDVMLRGIDNLKSINILDADTKTGLRAGWVLIDRIFRSNEFKFSIDLSQIPIIILSTMKLFTDDKKELEELNKKIPDSAPIHYISKREMNENIEFVAQVKFEHILNKIK